MKRQIWSRNGNGIIRGDYTEHNISPYGSLWEVAFDEYGNPKSEKCIGANVAFHELTEKQIKDTIEYFQIGTMNEITELVGVAEVAEMLGWSKGKVSVYHSRGKLPKPVQELKSGPLWRRIDIEEYREEEKI